MQPFIAALLGGLLNIAASLAGRVLLSLGFSVLTFSGLSVTLTYLRDQAVNAALGMGPVVSLLAFMKVGTAISIIFSAYAARLALQGLSAGGSVSKLVMRKTGQ